MSGEWVLQLLGFLSPMADAYDGAHTWQMAFCLVYIVISIFWKTFSTAHIDTLLDERDMLWWLHTKVFRFAQINATTEQFFDEKQVQTLWSVCVIRRIVWSGRAKIDMKKEWWRAKDGGKISFIYIYIFDRREGTARNRMTEEEEEREKKLFKWKGTETKTKPKTNEQKAKIKNEEKKCTEKWTQQSLNKHQHTNIDMREQLSGRKSKNVNLKLVIFIARESYRWKGKQLNICLFIFHRFLLKTDQILCMHKCMRRTKENSIIKLFDAQWSL